VQNHDRRISHDVFRNSIVKIDFSSFSRL